MLTESGRKRYRVQSPHFIYSLLLGMLVAKRSKPSVILFYVSLDPLSPCNVPLWPLHPSVVSISLVRFRTTVPQKRWMFLWRSRMVPVYASFLFLKSVMLASPRQFVHRNVLSGTELPPKCKSHSNWGRPGNTVRPQRIGFIPITELRHLLVHAVHKLDLELTYISRMRNEVNKWHSISSL